MVEMGDGWVGGGVEAKGRGQGKLEKRVGESGGHWREEKKKKGEEWGISENRGTLLWCRVSRSDFCPFRIRFLLQSGSPKATERGGWIKRERPLCFVFFFIFSSGGNKKKQKERPHIPSVENSFLFCLFFPIKKDKQRMIHRFHTGVRF